MFLAIPKVEVVVIIIMIDYPPMKSKQIHLLIIQEVEGIEVEAEVKAKVEAKGEAKEETFFIL